MAMQPSLLDDLGEEVTGIMAPVSLCMAVTVLLVRLLNPEGASSSNSVLIASIAYQENASDSSGKKLGGALLNAIIFVAVIAGMTMVLFLLFKYKCYKFIYGYMGFAVFNIFFFLTGALFIQVMQVINLHIDAFSLAYGLFNFSVVGTLGLLFMPVPLLLKQMYLIWVGIIVAYIFTFIPEWTSWVILVFMALYDIAAVLIPGGPLKALVELAIERRQDLPALIYEARPAGGRPYVRGWGNRAPAEQGPPPPGGGAGGGAPGVATPPRPVAEAAGAVSTAPTAVEMRRPASRGSRPSSAGSSAGGAAMSGGWVTGPSRASLAAAEPTALPRGSARQLQQQQRREEEEGEEGLECEGAVSPDDAVRAFASPRGLNTTSPQQSPRRFGIGTAAASAGGGGVVSFGGRPLGEGRELDGEGDAWQPLPAGATSQQPHQKAGGGGGDGTLRGRLSRVLSASNPRDLGGDGDGSSHTSQEPLIDSPSSTAGTAEKRRQQRAGSLGVAEGVAGAGGNGTGEVGPLGLQTRASGSPGPSNPAAASFSPSRGSGGAGWEASPPKQQRLAAGSGGSGGLRDDSTMGVRAVAPALSEEQLAEAVSPPPPPGADLLPPAGSLTPAPAAGRRTSRNASGTSVLPPQQPGTSSGPPAAGGGNEGRRGEREGEEGGEAFEPDLPDAIKLGLGDFIFYSMLVGRAAMYDFMTVFSSYLAIIAGLGLTLLCLAIYQKALPALPFSIALGVAFYFLTRLTLEPFLVPMAVHLAYY